MSEIAIINGMKIVDEKAREELTKKLEKISVNGTELPTIDNKVDIPVPTKTSDLANDSQFVNLAMLNEALSYKQNTVPGKGLSSNDYTDEEKTKLAGIENGAQANVIEKISVNGKQVDISEKSANITVSTETQINTVSGTEISITAIHNSEYRFTDTLVSLNLIFPDNFEDDYTSWFVFKSGETPTSIIYPDGIKWSGDNITDGEFVPAANTFYNIGIWHDGFYINGVVRGVTV